MAIELLDGDNKFDAGDLGMQDAEKGVIFTSFPPVLHLHLMRFEYDATIDACAKSNDRFEFSVHLSLCEFLQPTNEGGLMEPNEAEYTLQSVLVHSGDNQIGHYIVFIDPKVDGNWFKFDDDRVCATTRVEAIDYNFGGYKLDDVHLYIKTSNSSAYMLVYIRDSEIPTVLNDVLESDIPEEMVTKLMYDRQLERLNIDRIARQLISIPVRIRLEEHFDTENAQSLFEESKATDFVFYLQKKQTVQDLVDILSKTFRTPPERMRLWPIRHRKGCQSRLTALDHNIRKRDCVGWVANHDTWTIFLEFVPADDIMELESFNNTKNVLLFLKYYDPALPRISYCGFICMRLDMPMNEVFRLMCELSGLPAGTALALYEEINTNNVRRVFDPDYLIEECLSVSCIFMSVYEKKKLNSCCYTTQLQNKDDCAAILIFERADQTAMNYELPTCEDFFEDFNNRMELIFVDKSITNDPGFTLVLSELTRYPQMVRLVANHLNIAVERLQFFKCNKLLHSLKNNPIKSDYTGTLKELVGYNRLRNNRRFLYQRLEMDLTDLENRRHITVNWVNIIFIEVF